MVMSKNKVVIALDLGTTGNRAIACNEHGEVIASVYYEFEQIFPKANWVEHDPELIWQTSYKALSEVVKKVGYNNVVSIGITNQRETSIIWDKKTGKPIHNAIVWQCRRTTSICEKLAPYKDSIKEKTGLFLDPYFSASKIQWILNQNNAFKARAENGELLFGTVDTWILWKLTEGKVHATDTSNASRTMLFNINTLEYDNDLLKLFDIPEKILPKVLASNSIFGHCSLFKKEFPISAILGDQQAALFYQCGFDQNVIKNTYGTGLFIVATTGKHIPKSNSLVNTIAWTLDHETTYALEGSIFIGGAIVQWLRDKVNMIKSSQETSDIAYSVDNNDGLYLVPALTGLGAPHWDPHAQGLLYGISRRTTQAHIVRAALESLAYQTRDVIDSFKNALSKDYFSLLRVDGGASHNDFLMQFQADLLQMPIEQPSIIESTALGVAGLAGIGVNFWTKEYFFNLRQINKKFIPKQNINSYYKAWQKALSKSLTT